ncbi:MAG TPA: peptidoglycan-binding domain-containing protein [Kofleriaceae bacterium]|nr:peptidoglycan-binding domain-containing protein [Kofleriaceae bacterium]
MISVLRIFASDRKSSNQVNTASIRLLFDIRRQPAYRAERTYSRYCVSLNGSNRAIARLRKAYSERMVNIGRRPLTGVTGTDASAGRQDLGVPGKHTLTEQLGMSPAAGIVQRKAADGNSDAAAPALRPTIRVGSHGDDVWHLQDKLNAVMGAGLTIDGKFGPATLKAVQAFQAAHGLAPDGVVGPLTWGQLEGSQSNPVAPMPPAIGPGGTPGLGPSPPGSGPAPAGGSATPPVLSGVRAAIVNAARGEIGVVKALAAGAPDDTGKPTRVGWEHLMDYFETAFGGSGPGKYIPSSVKYHSSEHPNQQGLGGGLPHWCGIFATWACKKGGAPIGNWKIGKGVARLLDQTWDPQPGDIGYLQHNQHHFIVVGVDGDTVHSIDGNSGSQSEVTEGRHDRKTVSFFRVPV